MRAGDFIGEVALAIEIGSDGVVVVKRSAQTQL
jgi:hypothetical protein